MVEDTEKPFWINVTDSIISSNSITKSSISKKERSERIINLRNQTKTAFNTITIDLKQNMVKAIFNNNSVAFDHAKFPSEEMYKDRSQYKWLPFVPEKKLGVKLPAQHLQKLKFESVLPDLYTKLQLIAAGLEHVFKNKKVTQQNVAIVKGTIKVILAEIYDSMVEENISVPSNVMRSHIPENFHDVGESRRDQQNGNWIVFKLYLVLMEYCLEVFCHFARNVDN